MSMMRVAIAGTGGLARLIAHCITETTAHQVVFLSRNQQPWLVAAGYQVAVVDYTNAQSLQFALLGIDTIISTVTGVNQISLIAAAVAVHVRRFAPAEFEGLPGLRVDDARERYRAAAREWLAHYSQQIQSTVFVCGILYERFQPGGLAQLALGRSTGLSGEGDYIMDCNRMTAQVPAYDAQNESNVTIAMTALQDVARFVTKALDMPIWPPELRMMGTRVQVKDLVNIVQQMKGRFDPIHWHAPATLRADLQAAIAAEDLGRQNRARALIQTAEGRYDFISPNLNQHFPDVIPLDFQSWFRTQWRLD